MLIGDSCEILYIYMSKPVEWESDTFKLKIACCVKTIWGKYSLTVHTGVYTYTVHINFKMHLKRTLYQIEWLTKKQSLFILLHIDWK